MSVDNVHDELSDNFEKRRYFLEEFAAGRLMELARLYLKYWTDITISDEAPVDWLDEFFYSEDVSSNIPRQLDLLEAILKLDKSGRLVALVALGPLDNLVAREGDAWRVSEAIGSRPNLKLALRYWSEHGYGV